MKEETNWHLSRSFNLSFLFGVMVQTVLFVWYVSGLDNTIKTNSKDLIRHDARIEALEDITQSQAITMARIDENIKAIRDMMEAMK